jgi:hypothetical protein
MMHLGKVRLGLLWSRLAFAPKTLTKAWFVIVSLRPCGIKGAKQDIAVIADADTLTFQHPFGAATRIIVGAAGAVTLLAPYELLIRPGAPLFALGMIPFWIIAIGALSIGLLCITAALLGLTKTVRFDATQRVMDVRTEGSFSIKHRRTRPFADLGTVGVSEDCDTDGPPRYRLDIVIAARKRLFEIAVFPDRAAAEAAASRPRALLMR